MQHYLRVVTDNAGNVKTDATYIVYEAGTTTEVDIYSIDDNTSTPKTYPASVNSDGYVDFFADDNIVDILISVGDYNVTLSDVEIYDASDAIDNATAAAASAAAALASENAAATSASNAATSETNAATSASNASTSASNAATSESNASISATNADSSATAAAAAQTAAEAAQTAAETAQSEAEDARDEASETLNGVLAAIDSTYTGLNIVASGVYPVGDWRNQVQTSYMLEDVPSGSYLGVFTTAADALTAGGVAGDWYFRSSGLDFRRINADNSSTVIYRAGSATMPSLIGVVATTSRVIIFDLTKDGNGPEMWMEYSLVSSNLLTSGDVTSVGFAGSRLYIGQLNRVVVVDYATDETDLRSSATTVAYKGTIAQRNDTLGFTGDTGLTRIVNNNVNSVATYLSGSGDLNDAGVEIPYVLCATDGGVSQIDPSGDVFDLVSTSGGPEVEDVAFNVEGPDLLFTSADGASTNRVVHRHAGLLTADKSNTTYTGNADVVSIDAHGTAQEVQPGVFDVNTAANQIVIGTNTDNEFYTANSRLLAHYLFNETNVQECLGAFIKSDSTTGYMKGDIQHASLGSVYRDSDNLISNGTFDDDSAWTLGTGWSIAGGKANATTAGNLDQAITVTEGVTYAVTLTVTLTAGNLTPLFSGGTQSNGTAITSSGEYTQFITAKSGNNLLRLAGSAVFSGSIDNVIVREAVGDERILNGDFATDTVWGKTNTATISGGVLSHTAGGGNSIASQSLALTTGKTYAVTFTVLNRTAGNFTMAFTGGTTSTIVSSHASNGTFTFYATANSGNNNINIQINSGFDGDIDNVRVRETLVNDGTFDTDTAWTKGDGWSIGSGVASSDGTQTANSDLEQSITTSVGKTYEITYTISNRTAGGVTAAFEGTETGDTNTADGTYTDYLTAANTSETFKLTASSTFVGDIDDVSVVPVTADLSGNGNHLNIIGELAEVPVASESELTAVEGFSANSYLESEAGMDGIGTGDFCFSGWAYVGAAGTDTDCIFQRQDPSTGSPFAGDIMVDRDGSENIRFLGAATITSSDTYADRWVHFVAQRSGTTIELFLNGTSQGTGTDSTDYTDANAVVRLGAAVNGSNDLADGKIALFRFSNTVMTAADVADVYRRELQLFQENANCTLTGTSDAVTGLAYDKKRGRVHAATSGGTSVFKDLVRVDTGTNTDAISAHDDATIGDDGSDTNIEKPAVSLRTLIAELRG